MKIFTQSLRDLVSLGTSSLCSPSNCLPRWDWVYIAFEGDGCFLHEPKSLMGRSERSLRQLGLEKSGSTICYHKEQRFTVSGTSSSRVSVNPSPNPSASTSSGFLLHMGQSWLRMVDDLIQTMRFRRSPEAMGSAPWICPPRCNSPRAPTCSISMYFGTGAGSWNKGRWIQRQPRKSPAEQCSGR